MENRKLKLPIGIQTFEEIRTDGYVYVDKTKYFIDMIDTGKIYFLARPRRFGKSLAVSTFDALFSGRKDLFKGLYAEEFLNRPDFQPSPVIWLDMSKVTTDEGIAEIKNTTSMLVRDIAGNLEISLCDSNLPGVLLNDLIIKTAKKYNQRVVILLDEYDSPYTDFVNDPAMANKVRALLRNFYVQIKANDRYIHFTFITGISKFARFGVFSTLNTPADISLMPEYAAICGYTEDEIIQYFPDYLEETAGSMQITTEELIAKMRNYYNGFSFDDEAETRLYNPYSTLCFFSAKKWYNYWMETGKPKVIAEYLKNRHLTVEQFRNFGISMDFAKSPGDMDSAPPEGFLYQCGYLTLRKKANGELYFDYPNVEVLNSMSKLLTQNIVSENAYNNFRQALIDALDNKDIENLVQVFNRLLASIPYDDFTQAINQNFVFSGFKFPVQEWLYRSCILSFLRGCGTDVNPEIHTNMGRSDLVINHRGVTWVIEIKVAYEGKTPEAKTKQALQQMETKNYAKPYADAVSVVLVIDDATRQIKTR
jgi:hypothetical protein